MLKLLHLLQFVWYEMTLKEEIEKNDNIFSYFHKIIVFYYDYFITKKVKIFSVIATAQQISKMHLK